MPKFFYDIFINFCLLIDNMILGINKLLFDLFIQVAEVKFANEFFDKLINNLYVIVGIFVLFRVAFSLIQMLANPDLMSDKEKGAGKLATRIVISFGLIIMVPTIFSYAYDLQSAILNDNILGRLILGDSGATGSQNNAAISSQGEKMSFEIFRSMLSINKGLETSSGGTNCKNALGTAGEINDLRNANGTDCFIDREKDDGGTEVPIFDYKFLVSTLALGMVAWLMVGFCIDIGVRLVKLTFLQLIAPICIVTYIGGGKDNTFNKWMKMTISSYVSMFVKLIIIYFIIFIAGGFSTYLPDVTGLGYVIIILGLLVFAKNAPKLIGDLFGVKMDSESGFKGIAKTALLGGAAMAASGGLAGMSNIAKGFGDTVKNVQKARASGATGWGAGLKGAGSTLLSGLGGMAAGTVYGAKNGFGKNTSLGGSINKALMTSRTNRDNRDDRAKVYGSGASAWWNNTVADRVRGFAGLDTEAKRISNQQKSITEGISRARSNVRYRQNELATSGTISDLKLAELNEFTYNALANNEKGAWFRDGKEISEAEYNTYYSSQSADAQTFLDLSQRDGELEGRLIKESSKQSKAETQQKKMEGNNGGK